MALQRPAPDQFAMVGHAPAADGDRVGLAVDEKRPLVITVDAETHDDAVMPVQFIGVQWHTHAFEVAGRGAYDAPVLADGFDLQAAVGQRAVAHSKIEALADQVDEAVGEVELDADLAVLVEKAVDNRHDARLPQIDRSTQAHRPTQALRTKTHPAVQLLRFGQQAAGALGQRPAFVRQADRARGAGQQRHAIVRLQCGQPLGHRGGREPQLTPGGRKPALLDDQQEQLQVVEHHSKYPKYLFDSCWILSMQRKA